MSMLRTMQDSRRSMRRFPEPYQYYKAMHLVSSAKPCPQKFEVEVMRFLEQSQSRPACQEKVDPYSAKLSPAQISKPISTSACFFFLLHILLSRPSNIPLLNSICPGSQPKTQLRPHIPEAAEIESALLIQATCPSGPW
jgi:hypothetical protein